LERLVAQSLKAPARVWKSALEEQERLAAVIPGARLRVVPETGHSPHLERPEQVVDDLDAFMRAA
jgi:pimeloyl-ACP methyl ester carboxylesterase